MSGFQGGAVLYAKDLDRVETFYRAVVGLALESGEDDHVVLASPCFQLVVLKIPERLASTISIESPPRRRADTPIKLAFAVTSIADAREAAAEHGGALDPPEREWNFRGHRVCDGHDPEGNVFQLREEIAAHG